MMDLCFIFGRFDSNRVENFDKRVCGVCIVTDEEKFHKSRVCKFHFLLFELDNVGKPLW
jgi:hypothetical protein